MKIFIGAWYQFKKETKPKTRDQAPPDLFSMSYAPDDSVSEQA